MGLLLPPPKPPNASSSPGFAPRPGISISDTGSENLLSFGFDASGR